MLNQVNFLIFLPFFIISGCYTAPEKPVEEKRTDITESQTVSLLTPNEIINEFLKANLIIDTQKSSLTFIGKSSIINHNGSFESFTVNVIPNKEDPDNPELASVEVVVSIESVNTDNDILTKHLKEEDFFDVENFPEARFISKEIVRNNENSFKIIGDLTIKGITKETTLEAKIQNETVIMEYNLPRKDFTIGNDSYGNKLLHAEVPVTATLFIK